ncbi:hypothetical protein VB711_25395 [Cronbergia sp. UHCC 0137]|uniref:hypothetical protein n=1 Tax=Cronbergia sp. UHCC 0137 TaxID=3110239 RepID=UPI002B20BA59|nr:hypothetical protein [Cronbergia sp. UHCC 0137]MEA5621144.1 hypothetical protein [Cronbergia sp. UHCC 0137]
MSADPVWCLFRVKSSDMLNVKILFDKAVDESQTVHKLDEFMQNKTRESNDFQYIKDTFNRFIPGAFVNKQQNPQAFDWDILDEAYHLFFSKAFVEMFENLFITNPRVISESMSEAQLDFIITNRVGATEILWGGLGWERANRLPGYFGNMFLSPEDIATVLANIEKIFEEVDDTKFFERAQAIGARGNANEDVAKNIKSLFLSALNRAFKKGDGFLALSYPHIGSMPFPEHGSA